MNGSLRSPQTQPGDPTPQVSGLRGEPQGVPARPVQQPLGPQRRPITHLLRDRPPVTLRQVTDQRPYILLRLKPRLGPHETRPPQPQQLTTFPGRKSGPYPGSSSRLRFCCLHTRMIDRRLPTVEPAASPHSAAGQTSNGCCRTSRVSLLILALESGRGGGA
jgi:hypothetical protein